MGGSVAFLRRKRLGNCPQWLTRRQNICRTGVWKDESALFFGLLAGRGDTLGSFREGGHNRENCPGRTSWRKPSPSRKARRAIGRSRSSRCIRCSAARSPASRSQQAVSPALFAKVYEAFLDYQLILFRDVDLPPATQVAFARNFGEVQVHVLSEHYGYKDHPEIYFLSNLDTDGNPSGKHPDKGTLYLAHRRLLARAHRAGDDDVFGNRAAGGRRRNRNSPTCIRLTIYCPPR